ncbi:hypothetical protein BDY24DRAFT_418571 [Mrakia frigida]|uniref:uncharacterized protein n=1 Tax=Mrakia frigida TaxID=29902 RepID=UPI003FCC096C
MILAVDSISAASRTYDRPTPIIAAYFSLAFSLAALNIVLRIVIRIIASKGRWTTFCDSQGLHIYLLASPWVVWLIYIVSALSIGLKDRRKVFRAVLYCAIDDSSLVDGTTIFTAVINVITIVLEISVAIILCRQFLTLRSFRKAAVVSTGGLNQSSSSRSFTLGGASLPLIFRLGLFGLCVILALICSITTQGDFTSLAGDFSIVCIGASVIFIFGSQEDVLKAWHLKSQSSSHTSGPAVVSNLNANTSRGVVVTTETYVMDSVMPRVRQRDTDLESNEDRVSSGSEVDIGWGSQVALRKEDSKGGSGSGMS